MSGTAIAPDPTAPAGRGLLGMLRAWLLKPVTVRPTGDPHDTRAQGTYATGAVAPVVASSNPSAGLHHVNQLAPVVIGQRGDNELDKIRISEWARPALFRVAQDTSGSYGGNRWADVRNTGRKTVIAAPKQPSALPTRAASPAHWAAADYRTAPFGAVGAASVTAPGSAIQPGARTRWRTVPTTDSNNPPPVGP